MPAVRLAALSVILLLGQSAAAWAEPRAQSYEVSDLVRRAGGEGPLLKQLFATLGRAGGATFTVQNGRRLIVRAEPAWQTEIAQALQALRRQTDLSVIVRADLFAVDTAFAERLRKMKPIPLDELERQFLGGNTPKGDGLFEQLDKQRPFLSGPVLKLDDGGEAVVLSQQRAKRLAGSARDPRFTLEGAAFAAVVRVSSDRRFVRVKLTERTSAVRSIHKVKAWDVTGKEIETEVPLPEEFAHARVVEVPDGGAVLLPARLPPGADGAKDRHGVLRLTTRIIVAEEEEQIRADALKELLPALVRDALTNPRLKGLRDYFGTPGASRFALVAGDAWTWPKELRADVAGYRLAPAAKTGKRLLGLRAGGYRETGKSVEVTIALVNAGGAANGAAAGSAVLRYRARQHEKGWTVTLEE